VIPSDESDVEWSADVAGTVIKHDKDRREQNIKHQRMLLEDVTKVG